MDPNYQYGYQPHQIYQAVPAPPSYNSYNAGYAQPPAYATNNPGWSMPSGHVSGYSAPLPAPPQPITVINYQPPAPQQMYIAPLPVAYDLPPPKSHYNYRPAPIMAPAAVNPQYGNGYLQPQLQPRTLVPASAYQPIPQPSGFSGALGRVGILGKHEKKRIRKIQKQNDKMAMKQRKAATYVY